MADYISQFTGSEIDQRLAKVSQLETSKQDKLVSGTNIKTVGGTSILGSGDIPIQGGDSVTVDSSLSTTSTNPVQNKVITSALNGKQGVLVSGTNIKTVNSQSILGSGNLTIGGSNIDTVTISVDNTSGNPSGSGSVSGSTLSLSFSGLVGATGATGATGPQGPIGPIGPQGNSGYQGEAGELEVVNNLTDGGAAKALSAEMGKELDGKMKTTIDLYAKLNSNQTIADSAGVGQTISLTPTSNNGWNSGVFPAAPGDVLVVNCTGGTGSRAWCFLDESNVCLSVASSGAVNETVVAPANTAKVIINASSTAANKVVLQSTSTFGLFEKKIEELSDTVESQLSDVEERTTSIAAKENTSALSLSEGDFDNGNLSADGGEVASNDQIRSDYLALFPGATITFSAQNGYTIRVYEFKEDMSFNGYSGTTWQASGTYQTKSDSNYFRVVVNKPSGASGSPVWADIALSIIPSMVYRFIPYADESSEKYAAVGGVPNTLPVPFVFSDFEKGNIVEATGKEGSATMAIRLKDYFQIYPGVTIAFSTSVGKLCIFEYAEDKTYLGWSGEIAGSSSYKTKEATFSIRIVLRGVGSDPNWSQIALSFIPEYLYKYVRSVSPQKIDDMILEGIESYTDMEIPILPPSPQRPADGTEGTDINAETMTSQALQAAFEALLAKLPRMDNMQTLQIAPYGNIYEEIGRDATDQYDIKAYVFTRRNRNCYRAGGALYAWQYGGNTLYTDHRSPRIGDVVYSDSSRTASGYTVTAYNSTTQSATINGQQYVRADGMTVRADDIFAKAPVWEYIGTSVKVYDMNDNALGNATIVDQNTLTFSGKTYYRRPSADYHTDNKATIFLWGNEHGPQSDPNEPSIILYRIAKDLCEGLRENPFLAFLRGYCKVVMIPAANPYGINVWAASGAEGRQNGNGVNINRNYDTVGWASQSDTDKGAYAGSEPETQFIMNALLDFNPSVAVDIHCIGYASPGSQMILHWQGSVPSDWNAKLKNILLDYCGLHYTSYGDAAPETEAFGPDWIYSLGIAGGLIEMTAGPYATAYNGKQHTDILLYDDYLFLLNVIRMWYSQYDPTFDLRKLFTK